MTTVQLRRLDPAKNMARFYLLDVQQDLFGQWWFVREFGPIGSPGRVMQTPYSSLDEAAAAHAKLWKAKLKRGYSVKAQRLSRLRQTARGIRRAVNRQNGTSGAAPGRHSMFAAVQACLQLRPSPGAAVLASHPFRAAGLQRRSEEGCRAAVGFDALLRVKAARPYGLRRCGTLATPRLCGLAACRLPHTVYRKPPALPSPSIWHRCMEIRASPRHLC